MSKEEKEINLNLLKQIQNLSNKIKQIKEAKINAKHKKTF
jgi:hypothetical protein